MIALLNNVFRQINLHFLVDNRVHVYKGNMDVTMTKTRHNEMLSPYLHIFILRFPLRSWH